jgi:ankyrin repeat protein
MLSTLYFAIGHADNMPLARWLLEHGADPNDGESLYHSTELGHHEGLRLLLAHGADPKGTNALLRAMDFHDIEAVRMLMEGGGRGRRVQRRACGR